MEILLILSFLVTSLVVNAQMLQGKVMRLTDGDTIAILDATNTHVITLQA